VSRKESASLAISVVKVAYLPGSQSESTENLNGPIKEQDGLICKFKMATVFFERCDWLMGK